MTRILERSDTGPIAIAKDTIQGTHAYVCRCGLSRSQPFCDGSHKMTRDEPSDVLVQYVTRGDERVRVPVQLQAAEPAPSTPGTP